MYRFALRPKWIAGHLLAVVAVIVFVSAGFWQLRRLDERQERNAQIEAVADLPPVDVARATPDDLVPWRSIEASGTWVVDEQVVVRGRSLDGQAGFHVATPLLLDDGRALMVNRGWVPVTLVDTDDVVDVDTPTGTVTITGRLRESERAVGLAAEDPADGVLAVVSRVDVARLDAQTEAELLPLFAELVDDDATGLPTPVREPDLGEGPHLSYAVQWFLFAGVVIVGYPLVLRWAARHDDELEAVPERRPVTA
jgi:surfeit locus 1 family protein